MRRLIYIASDHNGVELKNLIINYEGFKHLLFVDLGSEGEEKVDYPDYAKLLTEALRGNQEATGILICGTGIGMSIAANRFNHIRAALCLSEEYSRLARQHNDANILVLSAKFVPKGNNIKIIREFLVTEFLGSYHQDRIEKLTRFV